MSLREKLRTQEKGQARARPGSRDILQDLKSRVHRRLIETLDLATMENAGQEELVRHIEGAIQALLSLERAPLGKEEVERLAREIKDETLGLGPLEPLLAETEISDILVNGARQVFVERGGKLHLTDVIFQDDAHLRRIIDRIVSRVGRRVDEANPMVDARLPDGSRVNAVIPPIAIDGPSISVRKFSNSPLDSEDMLRTGTLIPPALELLKNATVAKLNVLISGGTGAGKTTLLNILSGYIPDSERIVTIEDSAELRLQQPHVVRLETRPSNIEGKGEITQRDLVRNSLRMRPDRIILGEVRGGEALDMLQAMNTGHEGSICTLHANSPRDAMSRLETMVLMSGLDLPQKAIRQQISSALDLIVQVARLSDGKRKVVEVSEIIGMEGDMITMQKIFLFEQEGLDEHGAVIGSWKATGVRPSFTDRLRAAGAPVPEELFTPRRWS